MSELLPKKPLRTIDYEDVDDIIGVAAEMSDLEADRLSVEDLAAIAKDLEIPERYVMPAVAELARRRQALLVEEAERRRRLNVILGVSAALILALVIWAVAGNAKLVHLHAQAEAKRAQVQSVVERRKATQATWGKAADGPEKMAELSGAENRVRIERRLYDQAATAYNIAAGGFPGSLWASLFGHPDELPLSTQIEGF